MKSRRHFTCFIIVTFSMGQARTVACSQALAPNAPPVGAPFPLPLRPGSDIRPPSAPCPPSLHAALPPGVYSLSHQFGSTSGPLHGSSACLESSSLRSPHSRLPHLLPLCSVSPSQGHHFDYPASICSLSTSYILLFSLFF